MSQLNNYTLAPISEERVSEAAGVNSAAGSFGLSFGLAFAGAIMLATLSFAFTSMAGSSTVLSASEQQQVATALEDDAEVMSNTALEEQLAGQPPATQAEIIRINTDARPLALQVALLIPILAGLIGLFNSLRMMRLPDPKPSGSADGMILGLNPASAFRLADGVAQLLETGVKGWICCPRRRTHPPRTVGYLVPGAGEVTQGFGDDETSVVAQFVEDLSSGYSSRTCATSVE